MGGGERGTPTGRTGRRDSRLDRGGDCAAAMPIRAAPEQLFGQDGYTVEFSLPCAAYAIVAYGVSSDAFKAFIAALAMND